MRKYKLCRCPECEGLTVEDDDKWFRCGCCGHIQAFACKNKADINVLVKTQIKEVIDELKKFVDEDCLVYLALRLKQEE